MVLWTIVKNIDHVYALVSTPFPGKPGDWVHSVNLRRDLVEVKFFQLESLILAQNERWRQA